GYRAALSAFVTDIETVFISEYILDEGTMGRELVEAVLASGATISVLTEEAVAPEDHQDWLLVRGIPMESHAFIGFVQVRHESYWMRDFGGVFQRTRDELG